MLLSLVTGTYNRLQYLKLMIASVRQQLPKGITYEIIVVDGGSTDGTLEWCAFQPDIRLIEQGELRGAIQAFSEGAQSAKGDYVLLANDDVLFKSNSIIPAITHLEIYRTCAAVAFADNRTSLVTGDGTSYQTEGIGATEPNSMKTMVTYAQVGMFRKELGEQAGWWGWQDPIMCKSRTYGGDSYLSARLWEMGYTVDPVKECVIEDLIVRDPLRDTNAAHGNQDSSAYYERFPTVRLPPKLKRTDQPDRLRVLHCPVYEGGRPQKQNLEAGLTEAFQDIGALVIEVDYLNDEVDLPGLAYLWQPDLIVTQIQGVGPKFTADHLQAMRQAAPHTVIVNWNGDARMDGLTNPPMLDLLRQVDLQTTVNAAALPIYAVEGIPAAYWQIGFKDGVGEPPQVPTWDILYQANWYAYREPIFDLLDNLPYQVGIYGNDRRAIGNTHYSFSAQGALYKSATITIGDTFPFQTRAFVSNRVFQALANGAFLLQQQSDGLEAFTGLKAGVHYAEWSDVDDLREKIDYWLSDDRAERRAEIRAAGQGFVRANFSFAAQVKKLLTELLPKVIEREPA